MNEEHAADILRLVILPLREVLDRGAGEYANLRWMLAGYLLACGVPGEEAARLAKAVTTSRWEEIDAQGIERDKR